LRGATTQDFVLTRARPKGLLLVNPRSGDQSPSAEELAAAARERGLDVHLLMQGDDAATLAREATGPVGVAGGDGSLAQVAGVAAEDDRPFVCVPFGTRNHFARDLGLDVEDPVAALAAFDGEERRVDIGRGGDHWFVNNISLGLYASFVHDPARKTRNRVVALVRMLPAALGRSRTPLDLSLEAEGRREHRSALVVLVANNAYAMRSMADLGRREHLDEGTLHAYVIEAVSRRSLLGLLGRAVAGSLERAEGWSEWAAEEFRLEASRDHLHAAVDGEPVILPAPLDFEVRPRGLRVLLPPQAA
jgi:diacylglycerol kinase family enzyme